MKKPNFFIIGAPKCGTTALSEYLRQHPNVFMCEPKEPLYFATDFRGRFVISEIDYLYLFRNADPERHLAVGEGSTSYLFSKEAVPNILRFQPLAKIVVMVRNPVEMVISLHAQLLSQGFETVSSFTEAWSLEDQRRQGRRLPWRTLDPQKLYYSEWGRLGTQLQRVMQIVPENQLKVIVYDDLAKDTRSVYVDVLKFLGVGDDGRTDFPVVNERRQPKFPLLQNLLGILMQTWIPMRRRLLHGKSFGLWRQHLKSMTTRPSKSRQISPETYAMLTHHFYSEMKLLEQLLQRDLSHWYSSFFDNFQ
jgi:hypothetical protein